jgi:hypothetical protein
MRYELTYEFWYLKSIRYRRKLLTSAYKKGDLSLRLGGYSVRAMLEKGSIFVHIPKCAGTYINQKLYACLGGGHLRACDYVRMLGRRRFEALDSFAVMRDPWDRVYSAFRHLSGKALRFQNLQPIEPINFEAFVDALTEHDVYAGSLVLKPQYLFITDRLSSHKLLVNKIWDQTRVGELLDAYGVHSDEGGVERNSSGESFEKKDIYSEKMRKKIARLYAKDILLGKYTF